MKINQWRSRETKVIVEALFVLGLICIILANPVRAYNGKSSTNPKARFQQDQDAEETSLPLRSPRAESSYMRNYHYSTRGEPNGWDDGRQLSSFGVNGLLSPSASSPAADYAYGGVGGVDPSDNFVAAGGHGHSSYGHGGGGGGGHGHSSHGHGKDCNSALGLLGVLGLASYLQNVLRQMTTTTAAAAAGGGGRRQKRQLRNELGSVDVTAQILPHLMAIGHVRESNVSITCAYRPICFANKILTNNLGDMAGPVTFQLSTAIRRMLTDTKQRHKPSNVRGIKQSGKAGRLGKQCEKLFPSCPELNRLPSTSMTLATLL